LNCELSFLILKKFTRKIEDFTCSNCGSEVKGDGYTDHCPGCLWGKHVDNFPGDRENQCQGILEPIRAEKKKDSYRIIYRCQKCRGEVVNKMAKNDDFERLLELEKTC
jgi:hypothetical protein